MPQRFDDQPSQRGRLLQQEHAQPKPGAGLSLILLGVASVAASGATAAPNWDCQKGSDGKWTCQTMKGAEKAAEAPPAAPARAVEARQAPSRPPSHAERAGAREAPTEAEPVAQPALTAEGSEMAVKSSRLAPSDKAPAAASAAPQAVAASSANGPVPAQPGKRGWNCRAGAGRKGWDCSHAGPEPKGDAQVATKAPSRSGKPVEHVAASGSGFTSPDEARFRDMVAVIPADPWASCGKPPESLLLPPDRLAREQSPLVIDSNYSEMADNELYTFVGGVDMARADQRIKADFVTHDKVTHTLNAHGNVIYREQGMTTAADTAFLRMDTGEGKLRNAQYIFETIPARGKAEVTQFDSRTLSRHEKVTFTTCRPGNQDWTLHADRLKINKESGRATATGAWLDFKGIPFLYTPYISFPTDKRRQSGLLPPSVSYNSRNGFGFSVPYYWNIAPNYDATIEPRYMSRRGILIGGDFRYLNESGRGILQAQVLPEDEELKKTRGFVSWTDDRALGAHVTSAVRLNYVSDDRYLYQLWNTLDAHNYINRVYLPSSVNLQYNDKFGDTNVYANAFAYNYEMLDATYRQYYDTYRYPGLKVGASRPLGFADGEVGIDAQGVYFEQGSFNQYKRSNVKPYVRFPWRWPFAFVTPKVSLQHTNYWVNESADPAVARNTSRTLPTFSTDAGMYFERNTSLFGTDYAQTLEPRLFYLFTPYTNQDSLPNLDSAFYDFDFNQLFRENRFTGVDRVGDANQVSVAMTTRLINQTTGRERLRASIGKIVEITQPKVTSIGSLAYSPTFLNYYGGASNSYGVSQKDIIAEVSAQITDNLSVKPLVLYNYETNRAERYQVTLHYQDGRERIFNIGQRYRNGFTDSTDVSARLPVTSEWAVVGRWNYSWLYDTTLDSFLGVQRESCCWRMSVIARRWQGNLGYGSRASGLPNADLNRLSTNTPNEGIFFQLELKGLSNFGDSVDAFLKKSMAGYEPPEY